MTKRKTSLLQFGVDLKRFIKRYVLGCKDYFLSSSKEAEYIYSVISKDIQPFIDSYIDIHYISNFKDLNYRSYDAFIVGSDQVWRPSYFKNSFGYIGNAYFSFLKKYEVKKIAYAVSFGTDDWEYSQKETRECKYWVSLFNKISVREKSAVEMCNKYFNVKADLVLDPTFLLSMNDYKNLILNKINRLNTYRGILLYILDESEIKNEIIKNISFLLKKECFSVNKQIKDVSLRNLDDKIKPSVEEWLTGFSNAVFVITDSFHACVFSIIFNKPFCVFANKERGTSRFDSLLEIFDLQERMIDFNYQEFISKPIDWETVNNKLYQLRDYSISYLKEALS